MARGRSVGCTNIYRVWRFRVHVWHLRIRHNANEPRPHFGARAMTLLFSNKSSTVWCYGTVRYCVVLCGTVRYCAVLCGTVRYCAACDQVRIGLIAPPLWEAAKNAVLTPGATPSLSVDVCVVFSTDFGQCRTNALQYALRCSICHATYNMQRATYTRSTHHTARTIVQIHVSFGRFIRLPDCRCDGPI